MGISIKTVKFEIVKEQGFVTVKCHLEFSGREEGSVIIDISSHFPSERSTRRLRTCNDLQFVAPRRACQSYLMSSV